MDDLRIFMMRLKYRKITDTGHAYRIIQKLLKRKNDES